MTHKEIFMAGYRAGFRNGKNALKEGIDSVPCNGLELLSYAERDTELTKDMIDEPSTMLYLKPCAVLNGSVGGKEYGGQAHTPLAL